MLVNRSGLTVVSKMMGAVSYRLVDLVFSTTMVVIKDSCL
jgi:hypothetical protein